jgi:hypothetical protein
MKAYQFYVHDYRYSIPNVLFVDAPEEGRAREIAERIFRQSDEYHRLDAYQGDTLIFALGELEGAAA